MSEARTYRLYLSLYLKVMIFGALGLFTVGGLLVTSGVFLPSESNGPPRLVGIFLLGISGWFWYWVLSIPRRIVVSESGQIEFVSLLRRRRTVPLEIESITPEPTQFGFLVVKTSRGKIRILNQFDEFHEFLADLKARNPSVTLRGC